jgi:hypothetical protein
VDGDNGAAALAGYHIVNSFGWSRRAGAWARASAVIQQSVMDADDLGRAERHGWKRREWSRQFINSKGKQDRQFERHRHSVTLRAKFRAKRRRVGKSQRNLVLGWVRNWVEDRRPDEERPAPEEAEEAEGALPSAAHL